MTTHLDRPAVRREKGDRAHGVRADSAVHPTRRFRALAVAAAAVVLCSPYLAGQARLDQAATSLRTHQAMLALDRYLETWNSRNPATWASSLHFPHVRPGAGAFEMSRTPEEYAAGVDFQQTMRSGWHHSEWVSREVLQVGLDKVHVAGSWQRFTESGQPQVSSAITYIVTGRNGRWGIQARFAAGTGQVDAAAAARNGAAALGAVNAFLQAWNAHDPQALAASVHYPHVRIADGQVETWSTPQEYLAGPEPGRQRTWFQTRLDRATVVQTTSTGVNLVVSFSRLGRDGRVLSSDEGVFLAVQRNGSWKVQARSTMGV